MKISVYLTSVGRESDKSSLRQICFRVREGSADFRTRSGILVNPEFWDDGIPGYKRTTKLAKNEISSLNKKIKEITVLIHEQYSENCDGSWLRNLVKNYLASENAPASAPQPQKEDSNSLVEQFKAYLTQHDVCKARLCSIRGTIKKLERYQLYKRQIVGKTGFTLYLDTLTANDMQDIWDYIMDEYRLYAEYPDFYSQFKIQPSKAPVPLSHNFMTSVYRHIRSFLNWALKHGLTTNERWRGFHVKNEVYGNPIYLTLEERDKILATDFSGFPRLERHRDMFIFQCLIGCRVGDLYRLTTDNIRDGFLEYYPHKTIGQDGRPYGTNLCRVPLNDKAKTLITKYAGTCGKSLFPSLCSQRYNEDIKFIVMASGITRTVIVQDPKTREAVERPIYTEVSSHTARKTFIANLYKFVKDPNLIASMTGHSLNSKSFRRYRSITDELKNELITVID